MVRASASQSVNLRFISQVESYQKTSKMLLTASLFGAKFKKIVVESKPASLLGVSLGKALNEMPPSLCGRQVAEPSSLTIVLAQPNCRLAKKADEKLII